MKREERSGMNPEVLVVEDLAEDLQDLTGVFRDLGMRVVHPGKQVPIRFLASRPVDLVVLNLHYPDVDPFPLLAMARKKGIRAIVVSRSFHQEEALAACRLGAGGIWDLPLDRDRFSRSLREFFPALPAPRKKILVIDDVDETRSVFVRTLREGSFEVLESRTGTDGFRLAVENDVDLVLLDIGLPDVSGADLYRTLKEDPRTASVPVLPCTVRGRGEGVPGTGEYIQKPISPARLLERVSNFIAAESGKR